MSINIAMLLTNPFRPDPRVLKEARSLTQAGYKVTIICWDRQGELPAFEITEGFEVRRLSIRSGYGVGSRQVLYLPRFWLAAWRELQRLKPDIIHCHDLDTAPLGYWYALTHRLPWVFDAHEAYPEATADRRVNRLIYYVLRILEYHLTRRATHVITVGELLAQRFRSMGGQVSVVGNYQPLYASSWQPRISRTDLGLPADEFVVVYIGGFIRARAILPLIEATKYLSAGTVLLLGDGPQQAAIEAKLPDYPRVRYLGWVPHEQIADYANLADVIYYGLVADVGNNHYSSPNALFNALAAGKPLLTTNIGEIARIVDNEQCGVIVEKPAPEALAQAITQLSNPTIRGPMALNARRAAENTYNWAAAEVTLLNVYQQLLTRDFQRSGE